ncbi:Fasciclin-like arabinogalactan protein [Quillaja saponaria]|uniref:Fasciclin-like arabinogalactan protein n=1 Tax=Quillaja saponaria TaxID=32244 RepID=A0AAD7LR62_QUISA|nr:Fasciclin-like arabinogalactan protein [Quillaja saponaria]
MATAPNKVGSEKETGSGYGLGSGLGSGIESVISTAATSVESVVKLVVDSGTKSTSADSKESGEASKGAFGAITTSEKERSASGYGENIESGYGFGVYAKRVLNGVSTQKWRVYVLGKCSNFRVISPLVQLMHCQYPDYTTFNNYLTQTQLADQINSRQTITVLAVDNSGLSPIWGKPMKIIKMALSLHVILDYYDVQKLQHLENKTVTVTTLFQTSGHASQQGFLTITDVTTGGVSFASAGQSSGVGVGANLVKSVVSQPYNLSVVQVSSVIIPSGSSGNSNTSSNSTSPSSSRPSSSPVNPPQPATFLAPPPKSGRAPVPARAPKSAPTPAPSTAKVQPPVGAPANAPSNGAPASAPSNGAPSNAPSSGAPSPTPAADTPAADSPTGKAPAAAAANTPAADAGGGGDHSSGVKANFGAYRFVVTNVIIFLFFAWGIN